jgi:hypothetical protein
VTPLTKPIHRVTFTTVRDKARSRVLTVSMLPGDVLEFRPKGTRYRVTVPMDKVFRYAEVLNARARLADKTAKRAKR